MKNEIEYLVEKLNDLGITAKVINDSGWGDGEKGGRCISDFYRETVFSCALTDEELIAVRKVMAEKHCPGWTGVSGYLNDPETFLYRFSTTWDSSD